MNTDLPSKLTVHVLAQRHEPGHLARQLRERKVRAIRLRLERHVPAVRVELPDERRVGAKGLGRRQVGGVVRAPHAARAAEGGQPGGGGEAGAEQGEHAMRGEQVGLEGVDAGARDGGRHGGGGGGGGTGWGGGADYLCGHCCGVVRAQRSMTGTPESRNLLLESKLALSLVLFETVMCCGEEAGTIMDDATVS
jgi:hypothetical protein